MKHVMFDLETLGTAPGCVVLSIGAVSFDPFGATTGPGFYKNIEKQSCIDAGLTVDPDTEAWWATPDKTAAREALLADQEPLRDVVSEFHRVFRLSGADCIWCHGATFDEPIWSAAARALKARVPWKFFNVRDTRTLFDLSSFDTRSMTRVGTHHNALDDARFQAECVQAAYNKLFTK